MDIGDRRATLVGFAAALAVLLVLGLVVGVEDLLSALARADRRVAGVMVVVGLAWLLSWGMALRTVLAVLGVNVGVLRAFATFAAATFANNVTPFGQAGGEPVSALFISNSTDAKYETGLAAIASVDALNFVPSIAFAMLGFGYYATAFTLGRRLRIAAGAVAVLALVIAALGYVGWQRRRRIEQGALRVLTPVLRTVGRVVPRMSPPSREALRERVASFFEAIDRVATDRRQLGVALSFSALGWFAQMVSLWLGLYAIGAIVNPAVVLVAIPVAALSSITPLPGGLGGYEAILLALLAPVPQVSFGAAAAAVTLHRGAMYWMPLVLGAFSAGHLGDSRIP
jgi:uncharacterized protein (TIRG00374 family)